MPPSPADLAEHGAWQSEKRFWLTLRRALLMMADAIKDRYL